MKKITQIFTVLSIMVAASIYPSFAQQEPEGIPVEVKKVETKWKDRFCLFGGSRCPKTTVTIVIGNPK